jgi:hypothetical protein
MKIAELLAERKEKKKRKLNIPTKSQCALKRLSNVRYAQCVGNGLRAHDSDHTDGTGTQGVKGSGHSLKGKKAKSERVGGHVKDYS